MCEINKYVYFTPIFRRLDNSEIFSEASTPPRQIYIVDLSIYYCIPQHS